MCGSGAMSWREEPADGDPQVPFLGSQALGPLGLAFRRPVGVLHERTEVLRVPPLDVGQAPRRAARRSAASSRMACEHAEPRSRRRSLSTLTRLCPASASSRSSVRSSVRPETCAAASTVQPSTKTDSVASICALRVIEQPDAPFDGRTRACVDAREDRPRRCPGVSRLRPSRASNSSGLRSRTRAAASSMAKRQPVEAPADLGHGERVVLGQGEVVAHGTGSIDEQLHGGQRHQLLEWRVTREGRGTVRGSTGVLRTEHAAGARCGSWRGS